MRLQASVHLCPTNFSSEVGFLVHFSGISYFKRHSGSTRIWAVGVWDKGDKGLLFRIQGTAACLRGWSVSGGVPGGKYCKGPSSGSRLANANRQSVDELFAVGFWTAA